MRRSGWRTAGRAARRVLIGPATLMLLGLACVGNAHACPDCQLGRDVRARIASDSFWANLGMILLPLVLLAVVVWLLHRIGRPSAADSATNRIQET